MVKLELKHVLPYLDHKVLLSYNDCISSRIKVAYLTGVTLTEIETTYKRKVNRCSGDIIGWEGHNNVKDMGVKLHLRPLSDLTKEIEVNGKKFVPIDWLFKNVNEKLRFSDNRFMDYDDGKSKDILHYSIYDVFSDSISIDEILILTNKIFEWHFDVFGLIEKGLAVDINTL